LIWNEKRNRAPVTRSRRNRIVVSVATISTRTSPGCAPSYAVEFAERLAMGQNRRSVIVVTASASGLREFHNGHERASRLAAKVIGTGGCSVLVPACIAKCSTKSERDGESSERDDQITPVNRPTNRVGRREGTREAGTIFWRRASRHRSIGTIIRNRPISIANPMVTL